MRDVRRMVATVAVAAVGVGMAATAAPAAGGQAYRSCKPVVSPYPNTRYEDVDLTRIRALGVSCRGARRVARRAHYKALAIPPALGPARHFTWKRWRVTGDLLGNHDRYVARRGHRRVRWRF